MITQEDDVPALQKSQDSDIEPHFNDLNRLISANLIRIRSSDKLNSEISK